MILVDSSAWIEYLRASGTAVHRRLSSLIRGGAALATTDPVVMEVLAGARDEWHARQLRSVLLGTSMIPVEGLLDFEQAAALYRHCRARGVTVRRLVDCLIAAVAIRAGASVLHADADFDAIARHTDLVVEVP